MLNLDAATILLQWSVGGLAFLWVTTRRREVGIGYGWLLRGVYGLMAVAAVVVGFRYHTVVVRELASIGVALGLRCRTGRVVAATGRRCGATARGGGGAQRAHRGDDRDRARPNSTSTTRVPEFPPNLDLIAPVIGTIGLIAAGLHAGHPVWLQLSRVLVGAAFLGCVTDAMLLGHWYLTQPGLRRAPLLELVRWLMWIWPFEVLLLLLPTGMISVLNGTIDDGYQGMLGWFWVACAVTTIVLCFVTRAALKERQYSAVMAATGLLYLAILTAFGTDLVARALLS